jgi:hypothetical protein
LDELISAKIKRADTFLQVRLSFRLLIVIALLLALLLGLRRLLPFRALELLVIASVIYVVVGYEPVARRLLAVPSVYRWFSAGLLGLMLFGHLAQHEAYTFPFVSWTMYTTSPRSGTNSDVVLYEFWAQLRDGQIVRFEPARILPAAKNRIFYELRDQIVAIQSATDPGKRAEIMNKHVATLQALARLQSRKSYPI